MLKFVHFGAANVFIMTRFQIQQVFSVVERKASCVFQK